MGKVLDTLTPDLCTFIATQPMFFVATAPLAADGHINLSPKGYDCFRILSPGQVAYLDLTGSGNETSAHLLENGRITFMFCAFTGRPQILRLYGVGRTVLPEHDAWATLAPHFPDLAGARQIIVADLHRIQTSCGYGIPVMEFVEQRDTLTRFAATKGPDGMETYRREHNRSSIDDLPTPLDARYRQD
ncbi:MAG: pyridoxamine 5'-phosphate oxidase family protein [Chloroflexaceae bacterium]|nr:pyridoxamine 5'-phosphate oxidase family protein [Chloroflexaceae bacterium]NJO06793.1 pyridoxamine 5'-phosphate oxidase family protein [Chloroflexaceae bacterium]